MVVPRCWRNRRPAAVAAAAGCCPVDVGLSRRRRRRLIAARRESWTWSVRGRERWVHYPWLLLLLLLLWLGQGLWLGRGVALNGPMTRRRLTGWLAWLPALGARKSLAQDKSERTPARKGRRGMGLCFSGTAAAVEGCADEIQRERQPTGPPGGGRGRTRSNGRTTGTHEGVL